jgi:hypothetical protein
MGKDRRGQVGKSLPHGSAKSGPADLTFPHRQMAILKAGGAGEPRLLRAARIGVQFAVGQV